MKNKEVFLTTKNVNNKNIVLLSDIHYSNIFNLKIFDKIINQIKNISVDYIFIIGDLIDNTNINYEVLYSFLSKLEEYGKVFITLGNHDIYKYNSIKRNIFNLGKNIWIRSNHSKLLKIIDKLDNTYLLDNNSYIDNESNICITGINMSFEYYASNENIDIFKKEINDINIKLNPKYYNILLIHSPYNVYKIPDILNDYDLILSGHMHGGLVHPLFSKLFKKNQGLISSRKEIFANYVRGRTKTDYFEGYIYEGITKLSESSTKFLHFFDRLFPKNIGYIEINKIDTK